MRGGDSMQESPFTVSKLDDFVPADHPLRALRVLVNDLLVAMNPVQRRAAGCGKPVSRPCASGSAVRAHHDR